MKVKQAVAAAMVGVSLLGAGFWFGNASASTVEPGSSADPLVSKSYVDQVLQGLVDKGYLEQRIADLAARGYVDQVMQGLVDKGYLEQRVADLAATGYVDQAVMQLPTMEQVQTYTQFRRVDVPAGYQLLGEAGTEIVLRGGRATAVVSKMGGVLDATAGIDLTGDAAIVPNHLLVIPISDGRGITAQTNIITIVKGSYAMQPIQ